mgnify:CR=1 FL=1
MIMSEDERQFWLICERPENWVIDKQQGFTRFGLKKRYKKSADKVNIGDFVFTYIGGKKSCLADIREIIAPGTKPFRSISDYDAAFDIFLETKPYLILPKENWIPFRQIKDKLEMTRGKEHWYHCFRASIRKISNFDGEKLLEEVKSRYHSIE